MSKIYVKVTADFDRKGNITPTSFVWEDGKKYFIDEIMDKRKSASLKAGGIGMRYFCRIGNKETYLWYEEPAWFMEGK